MSYCLVIRDRLTRRWPFFWAGPAICQTAWAGPSKAIDASPVRSSTTTTRRVASVPAAERLIDFPVVVLISILFPCASIASNPLFEGLASETPSWAEAKISPRLPTRWPSGETGRPVKFESSRQVSKTNLIFSRQSSMSVGLMRVTPCRKLSTLDNREAPLQAPCWLEEFFSQ